MVRKSKLKICFPVRLNWVIQPNLTSRKSNSFRTSKGYGALVLRLADEVVEALFVTYDLWK